MNESAKTIKRLRKIERAAAQLLLNIGLEKVQHAEKLRRTNPGTGGQYLITHSRLDDLAQAIRDDEAAS